MLLQKEQMVSGLEKEIIQLKQSLELKSRQLSESQAETDLQAKDIERFRGQLEQHLKV